MSRKKVEDNEDLLVIKPLGAGQEVGRSCVLLEFKGKKVMVYLLNYTSLSVQIFIYVLA